MTPLTSARQCAILCVGGDSVLVVLYVLIAPVLLLCWIAKDS